MFGRIYNFIIEYLILWVPLSLILFQVELIFFIQEDSLRVGGFYTIYVPMLFFITNLSIIAVPYATLTSVVQNLSQDIFLIIMIILPPLIIYILSKTQVKEYIRISIHIFLCTVLLILAFRNRWELTSVMIGFVWSLTVADYFRRQLTKRYAIYNIYRNCATFTQLLERNCAKALCLSFLPITIIYFIVKKSLPWDDLCDTEVIC